jgi:ABC-2 type transport system permease protein
MVGILIRMKVAVLRHSMSGQRASETISGVSLGLVGAAGTIWLGTLPFSQESLSMDVLAAVFSLWLLGWIMGPIFFGGGDQTLRPEHFTLLPISSRRLAMGLFSAAFVGAGALVTLVAFTSLVVSGARLGLGPLIVAVPAALLQLAVIILLSRWVTEVLNEVMRSQTGAALGALISAAIMALLGSGWALAPTISQALTQGFPPALSMVVRALPSGWGLVAVDAASRSHWLLAIGMISGQAALIGLLLVGWSALLVRRTTTKKTARPSKAGMVVVFRHRLLSTTAVGAVIGKELRNWLRDPMRMHYLYFALLYALLFCLLPLALGSLIFLPWTAALFIVMAAMITNFYGSDGSALWLILVTPGAERSDVRGRQGAWGLLVVPTALVLTIVLTAVSGQSWAWPWVLAMTPALLGGAAGLILLISVF